MDVCTEIRSLRSILTARDAEVPVVFVPTMGALHDGHRSCIDVASSVPGAMVVVSIFVNPTQFGPGEDLDRYPRDLARDLKLCEQWSCDVVYAPSPEEIYPVEQNTWVIVDNLPEKLCGRNRPGHFRGVSTVVCKLFNLVRPDVAVFGQKDAQQALIIREMVRQLNMPVDIRLAPISRDPDGLARSSRNAYLSADERPRALGICRSFNAARGLLEGGERRAGVITAAVVDSLADAGIDNIEYVDLLCAEDLSPWDEFRGRGILAVAARVGATRLIDNVVFEISADRVVWDTMLF